MYNFLILLVFILDICIRTTHS